MAAPHFRPKSFTAKYSLNVLKIVIYVHMFCHENCSILNLLSDFFCFLNFSTKACKDFPVPHSHTCQTGMELTIQLLCWIWAGWKQAFRLSHCSPAWMGGCCIWLVICPLSAIFAKKTKQMYQRVYLCQVGFKTCSPVNIRWAVCTSKLKGMTHNRCI